MTVQQEIVDTIKKYDKIIIHRHLRPDPDALGSQVGLANYYGKVSQKKKYVK